MSAGSLPLVSVVTPAYNAARFLERTIESVRAQTFPDWEMLIVDDGSTDATREIVQRAASHDARVRPLATPGRQGPGGARNRGIEEARGRFLAFVDADDLWLPEKLERQLAFMRDRRSAFSFTGYSIIDENDQPIGRPVRVPARLDYRGLLANTIIGCLTVMLDRETVDSPRMPDLPQHEDLSLWFDILRTGVIAHGMPEILARYRIVRGSASRNKLRSALHVWKLYRERERLSLPRAAWCYAHYAWNAYRKHPGSLV